MRKWISSVYASLFPLGAFRQLTKRASLFLPTFSTMCLFELLLTPVGLHCHQFISGQTTLLVRWARVFVISEYPQYILLDAWLLLSHWLKIREEPLQLDSGFGLVSLRLLSLSLSTQLYSTILFYLSIYPSPNGKSDNKALIGAHWLAWLLVLTIVTFHNISVCCWGCCDSGIVSRSASASKSEYENENERQSRLSD